MNRIFNKIWSLGLWLQPVIMTGIIQYLKENNPQQLYVKETWFLCFFISLLPAMFIWLNSLYKPNEKDAIKGKNKATYPELNKSLLYKKPIGIVFGKDKKTNQYVCKDLNVDGHIFLIGGSGSGKSSCHVIPSILANPTARVFAIDIKGELSKKATYYGDENVLIFNPSDRNTYGYNPFFRLNEECKTQDVLEVMQNIAFSLISMPADLKDPFWKNSARNLLIGLMIYYYNQGITDFISIIDEILGKPVQESIDAVKENAKPNSVEFRYVNQFFSIADETLSGVVSEMNNHLVIFANDQDIRYAFKDNACKLNPHNLEEGKSIYLVIKEEKLEVYSEVLKMILNQTLAEFEKRPEDSEPIIMVLDELARILSAGTSGGGGPLSHLLDAARTTRSRNIHLFLISQSIESLMCAYSENEVTDLISNCPYIIVLSASSTKTQRMVCDWCGKYKAEKRNWNGGKNKSISISYEEKDIVEPADLMTLTNTGEAILITPFGYCRVKKTPYYKDKYFKSLAEKIKKHNDTVSLK